MNKLFAMAAVTLGTAVLMGGTASAATPEQSKPAAASASKTHEVKAGDSLSIIAGQEGLASWRPLWDANASLGHPDMIYAGQQLVVPTEAIPERPLPAGFGAANLAAQPVQAQASGGYRPAAARPAAANYAPGSPGLFQQIRQKESGGNYAINTGNGYYGAYQFDLATWRGVGGTGLPSQATPAEQDMRAQMLYDRRGCSPWPNTCR